MVLCGAVLLPLGASQVYASEEAPQETVSQETPVVKKGLLKEGRYYCYYRKGKKIRNRWVNIGSNRYFFNVKGYAVTNSMKRGRYVYVFNLEGKLMRPKKPSVVKVGQNLYYVDRKGHATVGWFVLNNRLYRGDPKGRLCKNRVYDGITFGKKGYAVNDTNSQLKMQTMKILSRITNNSMTSYQKLNACWNYVVNNVYYYGWYPGTAAGWQRRCALNTLATSRGNCYGYACAFAALAKEAGFSPKVVAGRVSGTRDGAGDGMTRHCWVIINGAYYDPEAHAAGWYRGVYGSGSYNINHQINQIVDF